MLIGRPIAIVQSGTLGSSLFSQRQRDMIAQIGRLDVLRRQRFATRECVHREARDVARVRQRFCIHREQLRSQTRAQNAAECGEAGDSVSLRTTSITPRDG